MLSRCFVLAAASGFLATRSAAQVFVGYAEFCGLPVIVAPDPQTASARKDQFGNPIIHIDPAAASNWTVSSRFTIAHECAHHLLGHTTTLGNLARFSGGSVTQELEADCWAAQKLRSIGMNAEINRMILQNASYGHFSSPGYPSGADRAANIVACAGTGGGEGGCQTVLRQCTHSAHSSDQVRCVHIVAAHAMGDLVVCQHVCYGPYGPVRCHPQGDLVPCQHPVPQHQFDVIPCTHPAHPAGDPQTVCP